MKIDETHEGYETVRQFLNSVYSRVGNYEQDGAVITARRGLERLLADSRAKDTELAQKDAQIKALRETILDVAGDLDAAAKHHANPGSTNGTLIQSVHKLRLAGVLK